MTEAQEQGQSRMDKVAAKIAALFAHEFERYFARSTHEQRLRGQDFICSVCTRKSYDTQGRWTEHKWLAVCPADRGPACEFPHIVCFQHARDVDDRPDLECIRACVEKNWDCIKNIDNLRY